ncbi:uncharacterized protein BCR38DRAFT_480759 [Pseudomassariella vexata]|uniref:Uncharacterized protein n=1 Tax=Pseudomassariella vexata TaxID=1141098 RepID=A0A1Y2EDC7_9PEZI|nr:uncharacterized protein BCR38DRAFT_480759 [Pseudomassariella vexata]ORY69578.1 hypothetical protein BCR38DRAFT_480759 [Pseudomassariella vexata]
MTARFLTAIIATSSLVRGASVTSGYTSETQLLPVNSGHLSKTTSLKITSASIERHMCKSGIVLSDGGRQPIDGAIKDFLATKNYENTVCILLSVAIMPLQDIILNSVFQERRRRYLQCEVA